MGIGAKTNVGYGQFLDERLSTNDNRNEMSNVSDYSRVTYENKFPSAITKHLKKNAEFEGIVFDIKDEYYGTKFMVNDHECVVYKKKSSKLSLEIDMKVEVVCANDYTPQNHNISVRKIKI